MKSDMENHPVPHDDREAEPVRWLRFLPRWSLLLAIAALSLPIAFVAGLGQHAADQARGPLYVELLQAARSPSMFRLAWTIDALIWLMLGVSLLTFAGLLRRHVVILAPIIAGCGVAQLFGAYGSFLRLDGISDLAVAFAAAPAEHQILLEESYLALARIIDAANHLGVLLQGLGFLLVAGSLFSLRGFPRWLAVWLFVPALLSITQFGLFLTGAPYQFVLNLIGLVGGNIALNFAIALALWRPSSALVEAVAGFRGMQGVTAGPSA